MIGSRWPEQKRDTSGEKKEAHRHPGVNVLWLRAKKQALWCGVELEHRRHGRKYRQGQTVEGTQRELLKSGHYSWTMRSHWLFLAEKWNVQHGISVVKVMRVNCVKYIWDSGHLVAEGSTGDYFTIVYRGIGTGMVAEKWEGRFRLQERHSERLMNRLG